ncbi:MAG: response regulator [bacterium]
MSQSDKPLPSARIMVVDDKEEVLRELVATLKAHLSHEIIYATNGEEALEQYEKSSPDLILLDVKMPGMNGYEVCRDIRDYEGDEDKNTYIVFLTVKDDPESVRRGFDAGGDDYVNKPVQEEELLARVDRQLELKLHRDRLEMMVEKRTRELEEQKKKVEQKNLALNEVIERLENREQEISEDVNEVIHESVLPNLRKLDGRMDDVSHELLKKTIQQLENVSEQDIPTFDELPAELTATEREICRLIQQGLTSPEISDVLNVQSDTVKWHRQNIREKLDLVNEDDSLNTYLSNHT